MNNRLSWITNPSNEQRPGILLGLPGLCCYAKKHTFPMLHQTNIGRTLVFSASVLLSGVIFVANMKGINIVLSVVIPFKFFTDF